MVWKLFAENALLVLLIVSFGHLLGRWLIKPTAHQGEH